MYGLDSILSASYVGDMEKVKSFIKRGAGIKVGTPLHAATLGGHKNIVELLLAE